MDWFLLVQIQIQRKMTLLSWKIFRQNVKSEIKNVFNVKSGSKFFLQLQSSFFEKATKIWKKSSTCFDATE